LARGAPHGLSKKVRRLQRFFRGRIRGCLTDENHAAVGDDAPALIQHHRIRKSPRAADQRQVTGEEEVAFCRHGIPGHLG